MLPHAERRDSKLLRKSEYPPHRLVKAKGDLETEFRSGLRPNRRKKNRRKWCRGEIGIPHVGKWEFKFRMTFSEWHCLVCQNCGRVMDMETRAKTRES